MNGRRARRLRRETLLGHYGWHSGWRENGRHVFAGDTRRLYRKAKRTYTQKG